MTKQEEANALRAMKAGSYFKDFFGPDIELMAQNVENDFPIELGCNFNKKAEVLEQEIERMKKNHWDEILYICQQLIKKIDVGFDEDGIYQVVEETIGKDAIIKYKRKEGLELSEAELDYLVSKL